MPQQNDIRLTEPMIRALSDVFMELDEDKILDQLGRRRFNTYKEAVARIEAPVFQYQRDNRGREATCAYTLPLDGVREGRDISTSPKNKRLREALPVEVEVEVETCTQCDSISGVYYALCDDCMTSFQALRLSDR